MLDERSDEFACPKCRSQSVEYPAAAEEAVTCRSCGTLLGTLAEFRRFVTRRATQSDASTSGC